MKGRQILVTGAGGFIGSHLVEALLKHGAKVRALIHYNSRGDLGNLRYLSRQDLAQVEIAMGDVADLEFIRRAARGCHCIFHLAALIGIPYSYVAPRSYVVTNVLGTLNVLEAVRAESVPLMVHTSTSEVYGNALYEPIDEDHPLQGQSPYSATKISADKLVESYVNSFDLPVATIRPFNTFGPRQSRRAVIPTIITQLLSGRDTVALGSLDPERDLNYVEDTVRAFLAVANCDDAIGEVINVGHGRAISIGKLAEMLINNINPEARISFDRNRTRPEKSEVMKLICSNVKAERLLQWRPNVSLQEGLEKTTDFIRAHIDSYHSDEYAL